MDGFAATGPGRQTGRIWRARSAAPRVAVGGIAHETNTFSPVPTTLADFRSRSYLLGGALLAHARGARNVLGGMIDAADERGIALLPTLFASAMPAGVVERPAWDHLRTRFLDRLRAHHRGPRPIDGVLLALHGAMVAAGDDDPEGTLLADVRELVGAGVPIVATLDSHANVTPAMVAAADLLVGYRAYPHLDTVERGREAVERIAQIRDGRLRPLTAFRQLPLLAPLPPQRTTGSTPMAEVARLAERWRDEFGLVAIDLAGGFPYADVPNAGVSVRVVTDDDRPLAEATADRLAAALWDRRDRFQTGGVPPDEAIARALAVPPGSGPVVLAEVADNPGAGGAGAGVLLLARLLAHGVGGAALAALPAPDVVARATAAGEGNLLPVTLGGPAGGGPLQATARVRALADGVFTAHGPMASGGPTRLGRTAVLQIDGVEVVVCERRVPVIDPALFRAVGIEPSTRRLLAVKSSVHFRAGFAPLAAAMIDVDTPGLSPSDLTTLPYRRVRRPIAPLDPVVRFLD